MNANKYNDILAVVSKQGQNPVQGNEYTMYAIWKSWYRGNVNNFHRYNKKGVGGVVIECERLSFGLPKMLAEEWTSLVWNENVSITVDNETINERVHEVLHDNDFKVQTSWLIEKAYGYAGNGAFIEYLIDGETIIDYITGDYFIVTQGRGNQAKGIITINEIEAEDEYITHLTIHTLVDGKYEVEHQAYISEKSSELGKSSRRALGYLFTQEELDTMETVITDDDGNVVAFRYVIEYDTDIPMFQVFYPNIANNYDTEAKTGIPVIANGIDAYKALDTAYTSLDNETKNNQTFTVFSDKASKTKVTQNEEGDFNYTNYIDKNNPSFIASPMNDKEDWVKHFTSTFDAESFIKTVDRQIKFGAYKAGLGDNYFNFDGTETYVNEKMVMSSNSDTWRNKVKHELVLGEALKGLVEAIVFLESSQGRLAMPEKMEITVKFDDTLIVDDEQKKKDSMQLVSEGYKPKWKHLVEWEGMTETEAKESVGLAQEEQDNAFLRFAGNVDNEEEDE